MGLGREHGGGAPAGGSGVQYFVGDFDGATFTNENPKDVKLWADYGPDFYAAQSFSDLPAQPARRIWIGWMSNWRYAHAEPTKPWRTAQSIPRELMLVDTPAGIRLAQQPIRELASLHGEKLSPDQFADAGQQLELHIGFPPNANTTIRVLDDGEHATIIGHDAVKHEVFIDRTNARGGTPFHKDFPARYAAPIEADSDGRVRLQILVDRSSVELFGHGGLTVLTASTFPSEKGLGWTVKDATDVNGEPAPVFARAWRMKSVWPEPKH